MSMKSFTFRYSLSLGLLGLSSTALLLGSIYAVKFSRKLNANAAANTLPTPSSLLPQSYASKRIQFKNKSELFILGSGSSSGVPRAICVADPKSTCKNCLRAVAHPPLNNPYYRGNPCVLIRYRRRKTIDHKKDKNNDNNNDNKVQEEEQDKCYHIQIDCGKTWREAAVRYFPIFGVSQLDSVLLTHEHADAIFGLDDIRSMQIFTKLEDGSVIPAPAIPIYGDAFTLRSLSTRFPYLCPPSALPDLSSPVTLSSLSPSSSSSSFNAVSSSPSSSCCSTDTVSSLSSTSSSSSSSSSSLSSSSSSSSPSGEVVVRRVSSLSYSLLTPFKTVSLHGLPVTPIPVWHGSDYESLGFVIGEIEGDDSERDIIVYISDISALPSVTLHFLNRLPHISLFLIDSLFVSTAHNTHFSMDDALALVRNMQPRPRKTLLIGMTDDFDHEQVNQRLKREKNEEGGRGGLDVELSYDGMFMPLNL